MGMKMNAIEVVTLFVHDIAAAREFYGRVFEAEELMGDAVSALMRFDGAIINLLLDTEAPELVAPMPVAAARNGATVMFTVRVDDANATLARLRSLGVEILNGPIDRPWGRRTAAFADPSGHVWEVAQEL